MIELRNVSKSFYIDGHEQIAADNISTIFPSGRCVALLGRNGAGKSTLLRMIAGTIHPDRGSIHATGTVSWPVGFAGSFHGELTGAQNVRFIARVYGVDTDDLIAFVQEFAEIGEHFHLPVRSYSSGMRAKLAFGLSMGIKFDTYLVDESTAVGDAAFRAKSTRYFRERLSTSGAIFATHGLKLARMICDMAAVMEQGRLILYDDINEGIAHHNSNMGATEEEEDFV